METLASFFNELYGSLEKELSEIEVNTADFVQQLRHSIDACNAALLRLMQFVQANGFSSSEQEIIFFKQMKPSLAGLLFYYKKLFQIELARPAGGYKQHASQLESELDKINAFFQENKFVLSYYRSGDTFLDDKLFVRVNGASNWRSELPVADGFISLADQLVTEYVANQKLERWIEMALGNALAKNEADGVQDALRWTDTKAALTEFIYAVFATGSFNNGRATIKQIADFFQKNFGIDLGNYYRTIQEIRIRKSGQTNYTDRLKKALVQYMDETDLNYKG